MHNTLFNVQIGVVSKHMFFNILKANNIFHELFRLFLIKVCVFVCQSFSQVNVIVPIFK